MTSAIDATKPAGPIAYTADVRANFAAAKTEIEALQALGPFLPLIGGTLAGPLLLDGDPANPLEATTKQYVDAFSTRLTAQKFNVRNYEAQGDGLTDDTQAFHATVADLTAAGGGVFYMPAGRYLLTDTTRLPSNTLVLGEGPATILLGTSSGFISGSQSFFTNVNNTAITPTDSDIVLRDFQFDYGTYVNSPTAHALNFQSVTTIKVINVIGQCRGCGDFGAMIGCYDSLFDGCSAFDFSNCAYDHWFHPQKARVVSCYAETSRAGGQMVNFNPEATSGSSTGFAAVGFIMANNHFVCTYTSGKPCQLEPLGAGTTVSSVIVIGNILDNCWISMRGAINDVIVACNRFNNVAGGVPCFQAFTNNGGSPSDYLLSFNQCVNPLTSSGNIGVIRVGSCLNSSFIGNTIVGSGFTANGFSGGAVGQFWFGNLDASGTDNLPGGALCLDTPDGATTGGNARGATSVDLQSSRLAATQVVTGANAIAAGANNTVAGSGAVAFGYTNTVSNLGGFAAGSGHTNSGQYATTLSFGNTANADFSFAFGHGSHVRGRTGSIAFTSGQRVAAGDNQIACQTMRARTTDATPTVVTADGTAPGAANVFNIPGYTFCRLRIEVIARDTTVGTNGAVWIADNLLLSRSDATLTSTTLSPVTPTFTLGGVLGVATGLAVAATADTVNGGIAITVTGIAAHTIDWFAKVSSIEVQ